MRAALYFFGLGWSFMGVAIVADVFMVISTQTARRRSRTHYHPRSNRRYHPLLKPPRLRSRQSRPKRPWWCKIMARWYRSRCDSAAATLRFEAAEAMHALKSYPHPNSPNLRALAGQVWNPTVANLTLMALGSSAPEILLSVIEIVGNGCFSGDLGPSTIVGSAAFNLLIIVAVCTRTTTHQNPALPEHHRATLRTLISCSPDLPCSNPGLRHRNTTQHSGGAQDRSVGRVRHHSFLFGICVCMDFDYPRLQLSGRH